MVNTADTYPQPLEVRKDLGSLQNLEAELSIRSDNDGPILMLMPANTRTTLVGSVLI